MAYTKTTWVNGSQPYLNADNLNKIEQGIYENSVAIENFSTGLPIGSGCDYFGTTAPENYMFADGSAISRDTYSELFDVIGTTYGEGDGSTTFNLPDKREAVTIMKGTTYDTLGASTGANEKAITKANLPSYNLTGTVRPKLYMGVNGSDGDAIRAQSCQSRSYTNSYVESTTVTIPSGGSGTAFNVMQKTLVCNYIIRVK